MNQDNELEADNLWDEQVMQYAANPDIRPFHSLYNIFECQDEFFEFINSITQ